MKNDMRLTLWFFLAFFFSKRKCCLSKEIGYFSKSILNCFKHLSLFTKRNRGNRIHIGHDLSLVFLIEIMHMCAHHSLLCMMMIISVSFKIITLKKRKKNRGNDLLTNYNTSRIYNKAKTRNVCI
jgi:hypothetical protein